jgi:hypothetical protein
MPAPDNVRDLSRCDQARRDALVEALEKGVASGVSHRTVDEIWWAVKAKTSPPKP